VKGSSTLQHSSVSCAQARNENFSLAGKVYRIAGNSDNELRVYFVTCEPSKITAEERHEEKLRRSENAPLTSRERKQNERKRKSEDPEAKAQMQEDNARRNRQFRKLRQDKKGLKRDTRKFLCDVDHHNLRAARKEALELAADEDIPYAEALKIIRTEHAEQVQESEECFASESSDDNVPGPGEMTGLELIQMNELELTREFLPWHTIGVDYVAQAGDETH